MTRTDLTVQLAALHTSAVLGGLVERTLAGACDAHLPVFFEITEPEDLDHAIRQIISKAMVSEVGA